MEYEYKEAGFKKASEALIDFENGTELFTKNYAFHEDNNFFRVNMSEAFVNFNNLYTRKEKAIDFEKEFTIDTPWMLKDYKSAEYIFAFACVYLPSSKVKFIALAEKMKLKRAPYSVEWDCARHLTKEEEAKYLGAEK